MQKVLSIVEQCKQNNPEAQRQLYDYCSIELLNVCFEYTSKPDLAEDFLQDAFIKIFNNITDFEKGNDFDVWIKEYTRKVIIHDLDQPDETIPDSEKIDVEEISDDVWLNIEHNIPTSTGFSVTNARLFKIIGFMLGGIILLSILVSQLQKKKEGKNSQPEIQRVD